MKRILSVFLCLLLMYSTISCDIKRSPSETDTPNESPMLTVDTIAPQTSTDYKQAYLDFLKDEKDSHRSFALVYLDDDNIPELYLMGACEAEGDMICSFKNGVVVYEYLKRTGGGKYIERGGSVINQNGNMGRCYTDVYKLGVSIVQS